ncbi:MAG: hypothetical protein ACLFTK_15870 [Anaerolineales bacterium]
MAELVVQAQKGGGQRSYYTQLHVTVSSDNRVKVADVERAIQQAFDSLPKKAGKHPTAIKKRDSLLKGVRSAKGTEMTGKGIGSGHSTLSTGNFSDGDAHNYHIDIEISGTVRFV